MFITKNKISKCIMNIMNNSTFGKTMEKLRKRLSVRLVDNAKD